MAQTAGKQFLHSEIDAGPNDTIEITLDHPANVQLLDPQSFSDYQEGRQYRYYGGYVTKSPYRISPPHEGHWHLVVDLGGAPGIVRASVKVLSGV